MNSCKCYRTTPAQADYCPCCGGHTNSCGFASNEVWLDHLVSTKPHKSEFAEITYERAASNEMAAISSEGI